MDDELTMLTKARQALAAGQSSDALRFLAEDTRRFPNSAFGEERAFTRIRALCELGRVTEARAEGERFTRQWPSSVYTSGVRRSCALTGREASGSSP
jgi:outer membrane protein assembly factor BamD (BamD/ComL family)